jgi:hypothetical protein
MSRQASDKSPEEKATPRPVVLGKAHLADSVDMVMEDLPNELIHVCKVTGPTG